MYEWQQEIKGRPSSITCIRYLTPPMQWETIRKMLCEDPCKEFGRSSGRRIHAVWKIGRKHG